MKLNLITKPEDRRAGYIHVEFGFDKLDVEDGEAEEILAIDVIDFLPFKQVDGVLAHWISKLRHGANLTVGGIDILAVANGIQTRYVDVMNANHLLFGPQDDPTQFRASTCCLSRIVEVMRSNGLKILKQRLDDYHYVIQAQRP